MNKNSKLNNSDQIPPQKQEQHTEGTVQHLQGQSGVTT